MQKHKNIGTEIEKPTARIYYNKLLDETKIDATWNLVRFKVRHLKLGFEKADSIRQSIGVGADRDLQNAVKDQIRKLCPYYKQLSDIYSSPKERATVVRERQLSDSHGSLLSFVKEELQEDDIMVSEFVDEESQIENTMTSAFVTDESQLEKAMALENLDSLAAHCSTKLKKPIAEVFLAKLMAMDAQKNKYEEEMLSLEQEKFQWTKNIEERKLKLEEKKMKMEYQMRQMELEQKERLLRLELQLKFDKQKSIYK